MNGEEFTKLDDKLSKIHIDVTEIKGKVSGHSNRIETCEKDRDVLFDSRNNHENRLISIETYQKVKSKYDGQDRRNKTVTFDWIMRIVMALFAAGTCIFLAVKTFGDNSQFHKEEYGIRDNNIGQASPPERHSRAGRLIQCNNYCCQRLVKSVGELYLPEGETWSGEYRILLHSPTCKKISEEVRKHNKALKFFTSDNVEAIKRQVPDNAKADVVVCPDCKLIRESDGKVCKAVCCVYYGWIVEKPRTAHRQNCRLLKGLENYKLICLACCPDKATLVSKGFHLCPTCFELEPDNPTRRKKHRHKGFRAGKSTLAYYRGGR